MFLKELSTDSKRAFLSMARIMMAADNVIAPEEVAMLNDVAIEMEIDVDTALTHANVEALCEVVQDRGSQAQILLELASLAHVDDDYSAPERELLKTIGMLWSVDPITLIRIEQWANSRIAMSREAAEIIQAVTT